MRLYHYKAVPAPRAPVKTRGVRGDGARFALAVEEALNAAASEGWEYVRSETLPCEHRGWFSRKTEEQTLLIFRRSRVERDGISDFAHHELKPAEPRLAAERVVPHRPHAPSLRAAPEHGGREPV